MSNDDSYYLTPNEAALAIVATGMKKSRLKLDTLIINSVIGGFLFSSGGMLHVVAQSNPHLLEQNPGLVHLLQGFLYAVGLFYVVILGAELFNSNILFFTVSLLRGAVSILDLILNWFISWLFNLGANLFVCYVFCYLSGVTGTAAMKRASIEIVEEKASLTFVKTFIRGIACNWFVSVAINIQLMCKPLHVKLITMCLPVMTFVSLGFSHTVADMFLCPMGIMNGADVSVATYIWKILIPESLGNIVGGSAYATLVPFYSHLFVVERDRAEVGLPNYEAVDEQPELMMDSRVVKAPAPEVTETLNEGENYSEKKQTTASESSDFSALVNDEDQIVQPYRSPSRQETVKSKLSLRSMRSVTSSFKRSPAGIFPVKGMGKPSERESVIANGRNSVVLSDDQSVRSEYLSNRLIKRLTTRKTVPDLEEGIGNTINPGANLVHTLSMSGNNSNSQGKSLETWRDRIKLNKPEKVLEKHEL